MIVTCAVPENIPAWLDLATEVEPLFGQMVDDPAFQAALQRKIAQGLAFCVRRGDGPSGTALAGGLFFSPRRHPSYSIHRLAVAGQERRKRTARKLVAHALGIVRPPAQVEAVAFAPRIPLEKLPTVSAGRWASSPENGSRSRSPAARHTARSIAWTSPPGLRAKRRFAFRFVKQGSKTGCKV